MDQSEVKNYLLLTSVGHFSRWCPPTQPFTWLMSLLRNECILQMFESYKPLIFRELRFSLKRNKILFALVQEHITSKSPFCQEYLQIVRLVSHPGTVNIDSASVKVNFIWIIDDGFDLDVEEIRVKNMVNILKSRFLKPCFVPTWKCVIYDFTFSFSNKLKVDSVC